jgi:Brp/Blh family beta-carotene 15,15'-monooxygenase
VPQQPDRSPRDVRPGESCGADPVATAATWSRWVLLGTTLATSGAGAGLVTISAPVALIVAGLGFVAGVPHGAADHVIATRLAGGRPMMLIAAVYAGVAVGAWALLRWADPAALIVAVALSALHFGLGELEVVRRLCHWRPGPGMAAAIVVAGCGALLLPLARCGDQLSAVATSVSPALAGVIGRTPVQQGLVAVWLLAALVATVGSLRSGHPAVALDVVIVGAVGMLAPPLVAFAVWFGGWHALRHCGRLLTVEPGCVVLLTVGRPKAAVLRLFRLAALPSVAAWTVLAGLGWFTVAASDPTAVVADVLRLLLALTVPHAVVVLWLDRAGRTTQVGSRRLISSAASAASASTSEPNRNQPTLASPRIVS